MINKDTPIAEIVSKYPETIPILQSKGLGCIGCIAASGESIEQGLKVHGLDVDSVIAEMNKAISNKDQN